MTWKAPCTPNALFHAEIASFTPDQKMTKGAGEGIATNNWVFSNLNGWDAIPHHCEQDGQ
jgi:hypothetical protein